MAEKRVLVIDDQYDFMEGGLKRGFEGHGFQVEGTIDPSKAFDFIKSYKPDIVLLDIFFPEGEMGKPILEAIKKKYPSGPPVIMISNAMREEEYHAEDYQMADARYPKELMVSKKDIELLAKEMDEIIANAKGQKDLDFIVGNTSYMKENVDAKIRLVADTDATVLITGESGTGKEKVARAIRKLSNRNKEPFIALNCGALPDTMIESELFGSKRGAFTGAIDKLGRIALAGGGTLFLDEIGDITPALQVKLLRVLREKEYDPLGGTKTLKADVRIIAATNKNLKDLVSNGEYREDLYYRLNVFPLHLPPLRERKEDIPQLAGHFIEKVSSSVKPILRDDVKALLLAYHWPGNIAELENVITSAVILAKNDKILQPIHFPDEILWNDEQYSEYPFPKNEKKNITPNRDSSSQDIWFGELDRDQLIKLCGEIWDKRNETGDNNILYRPPVINQKGKEVRGRNHPDEIPSVIEAERLAGAPEHYIRAVLALFCYFLKEDMDKFYDIFGFKSGDDFRPSLRQKSTGKKTSAYWPHIRKKAKLSESGDTEYFPYGPEDLYNDGLLLKQNGIFLDIG